MEAMTSHNYYRLELGIDVALADIESNKGVIYDAHIVDLCVSLFREKTIRLLMRAECDRRAIQSGLWVSTVFARRFSGQLFVLVFGRLSVHVLLPSFRSVCPALRESGGSGAFSAK